MKDFQLLLTAVETSVVIGVLLLSCSSLRAADPDPVRLHSRVAQVAPIFGVSVGTFGVRSTYRIDFKPAATAPQRAAGASILTTFTLADFFPSSADLRRSAVRDLAVLQSRFQSLQALNPTTPTAEYTAELVDLQSQIASAKTSAGLQ
jgi:hypothetical protein